MNSVAMYSPMYFELVWFGLSECPCCVFVWKCLYSFVVVMYSFVHVFFFVMGTGFVAVSLTDT